MTGSRSTGSPMTRLRARARAWAAAGAVIAVAGGVPAAASDAPAASARLPSEIDAFNVPTGTPDPALRAAVDDVRAKDAGLQISFREQEPGALSVSRFSGDRLHCEMRLAHELEGALDALAPMLRNRVAPEVQARFALAHELGHCRLRAAFMERADGQVEDPSVFPWLAQEVAADVYGILLVERDGGEGTRVLRNWIVIARRVMGERLGDRSHATGSFLQPALSLPRCRAPVTDVELLGCSIAAAYMTVGYLGFAAERMGGGEPVPKPVDLEADGETRIAATMRRFDSPADYERRFVGGDLARFEFRDVATIGGSHYLTAAMRSGEPISAAHRLADFYGLRVGMLRLADGRRVEALRVDGPEEWEWLKVLGAKVEIEEPERGAAAEQQEPGG